MAGAPRGRVRRGRWVASGAETAGTDDGDTERGERRANPRLKT